MKVKIKIGLILAAAAALNAVAEHKHVLMIGNSYTGGTAPQFEEFAEADTNVTVNLVNAIAWGRDWEYHYTNRFDSIYSGGSLSNLLRSAPFDVIIMQNHSLGMTKFKDVDRNFLYGSNLYNYCMGVLTDSGNPNNNPDVDIRLFMTWARRTDAGGTYTATYDRHDMQEQIRTNYNNLADGLGSETVPIGDAWERVYDLRPYAAPDGYSIHDDDATHGNDLGYYLNGAMFYENVYGVDARDAVYVNTNVPDDDRTFLLDVAHQTLAEVPLNTSPPPALEISTNRISVQEGGSASINLRLPAAPASSVTVQVVQVTGSAIAPAQTNGVTFTPADWDTWQAVILDGVCDTDQNSQTNILRCTADGFSSVYVLAEQQDISPLLVLSTNRLDVPEGQSASIDLSLSKTPVNPMTVTVQRVSGDTDLTLSSAAQVVFTDSDWSTPQAVTLAAAEDSDTLFGTAVFRFSNPCVETVDLTAQEIENDLALEVNPGSLTIAEGTSSNLLVRLSVEPVSPVTALVQRVSGDSSFSVVSGQERVFTAADYMNWQTSVVAAAHDSDQIDGSAVIRCSGPGMDDVDVSVTEDDDEYEEIFSGLLGAWNLVGTTGAVVSREAYTLAPVIRTNSTSGVLQCNLPGEAGATQDAIRLYDIDETSLANAIPADNYFTWAFELPDGYVMNVTSLYVITEISTPASASVMSSASGFSAGSELFTHTEGVQSTTFDLSANSSFQNLQNVEFRLYGYGGADAYDSMQIGDSYNASYGDALLVYGDVIYSVTGDTVFVQTDVDELTVPEGSTNIFRVRLSSPVTESTTVSVTRASGDTDLSVTAGSELVFSSSNWDAWQTVTLSAAQDADAADDSAQIRCDGATVSGVTVTATEEDDEILPPSITVQPASQSVSSGATAYLSVTATGESLFYQWYRGASGNTGSPVSGATNATYTTPAISSEVSYWVRVTNTAGTADSAAAVISLVSGWTAYHNSEAGASNPNESLVSKGSADGTAYSLVNYNDGSTLDAAVTYTFTGSWTRGTRSAAVLPDTGTDAYNTFNGILAMDEQISYIQSSTDSATITFSNLPPATYEVTLAMNRGDSYGETLFTLQDTTGATNLSSSGITVSNALSVSHDSDNTATGYTPKWGNITPTGQGGSSFSIRISLAASSYIYLPQCIKLTASYESGGETDTDGDGLPDDWETTYFGGATNANPTHMAANGINTVEETYIAGLNPTNSRSVFTVSGLQAQSAQNILGWTAQSGRVYSVYWASNLLSGFERVASNLTAGAYTDALHQAESQGFYRLEVEVAE